MTNRWRSWSKRRKGLAVLLALMLCVGGLAAGLIVGCGAESLAVNGHRIPGSVLQVEVDRRLAVTRKSNPGELKGQKGVRMEAETRRQVATELIKAELMRQEAARLGVTLAADEVDRRVQEEQQKTGVDEFDKRLREQGLSLAQYKKTVEVQAIIDALGQKVSGGITVTQDEAESFYLTNKDLFTRDAMVHVAHILTDTESQAAMAAAEARRGGDFAKLAQAYSKDEATRMNGGDLGWIEKGTREPAFDQAAFALQPGQVSGVVSASDGFHVIKVLERREATTPPFSEVVSQAVNILTNRKKDEAFSDWLRTVYANARVDAGDVGKWDPRLGIVVEK